MEMENVNGNDHQWAQIMSELFEGQEFAKQLRNQLLEQTSENDDHQELKCSLIEKMMSSFDKTIKIAKQICAEKVIKCQNHSSMVVNTDFQFEPPRSLVAASPTTENSHPDIRPTKRRKTMPRWTKIVQACQSKSISGLEGPLEDGFSWRKYGQKEILGAKFPRGYYRCTHRHSKGCLATKQVQRSDEDQSIYQVMYRGDHTCYSGPQLNKAQKKPSTAQTKIEEQSPPSPLEQDQTSLITGQEVFLGLGPDGDLKVEQEDTQTKAQLFRCFSFTTALLEPEPIDNFLSCSTDLASSPTSKSNYFPASSYHITGSGIVLNVQTSESDTYDPISGPNSVTNSPTMIDFEFPLEQLFELDPNFY